MIGWLQGKLLAKKAPVLMLDVNGVGYEVTAPMTTFFLLPALGEQATLFIHHQAREDGQYLYGFIEEGERELFRTLIKINGVGPKMALAILSTMNAAELAACVHAGSVQAMTAIPGVGKKTAERLIVELRDKLATIGDGAEGAVVGGAPAVDGKQDAIAALEALGYKQAEASRTINALYEPALSSEELIKKALQSMSRK